MTGFARPLSKIGHMWQKTFAKCDPCFSVNYGLLYNGYAVKDSRNLAPVGWHIPSITEWITLENELGGSSVAGGKLKETGFVHWDSPNTGATDEYRFCSKGSGTRLSNNGTFSSLNQQSNYWSTTEGGGGDYLRFRRTDYQSAELYGTTLIFSKKQGHPIRCIKDDSTNTGSVTDIDGNVYPTVKIGNQVWMASDLLVKKYRNGDSVTNITDNTAWINSVVGAWCYYNNTASNGFATCRLQWSSASNNLVGFLTVGNLVATGVTIGDYLIEWHLGSTTGQIVFRSGKGTDPLIQAQHPLTNEPVVGGNLYAVISYVWIDGIRYSSQRLGGQYSPDLITCMGYITVVSMNCFNGNWNGGVWRIQDYTHVITYTANVDPIQNAQRDIKFELNTDGSTAYFAYGLDAQTVNDRVTIYYVHADDINNPILLTDWISGATAGYYYGPSYPRRFNQGWWKQVLDLTTITYESGDYLLIQVFPRVDEPTNPNTNWILRMVCLTYEQMWGDSSGVDGYMEPITADHRTLVPSSFVWYPDTANCRWVCEFDTVRVWYPAEVAWGNYMYSVGNSISVLQRRIPPYCLNSMECYSLNYYVPYMKQTSFSQYQWNNQPPANCRLIPSGLTNTYQKIGNIFTIYCGCRTEYEKLKTGYADALAAPPYNGYTEDRTQLGYYKWFELQVVGGAETCGDNVTYLLPQAQWPIWAPMTWDDVNMTLTVTLSLWPSVDYVSGPICDNVYAMLMNQQNRFNQFLTTPNFTFISKLSYLHQFVLGSATKYVYDETTRLNGYAWGVPSLGWFAEGVEYADEFNQVCWLSPTYYGPTLLYVRITMLNANDPANNYEVIQYNDPTTGNYLPSGILIKRVLGGVDVTTPDISEPTTATDTCDAMGGIKIVENTYGAVDIKTCVAIYPISITETATADDFNSIAGVDSCAEPTNGATDTVDCNPGKGALQLEPATASDSYTVDAFTRAVSVVEAYTANHTNNAIRIRVADINEASYGAMDYQNHPTKVVAIFESVTATDWCDPKERAYAVERVIKQGQTTVQLLDSQTVTPQAEISESIGTIIDTPIGGYKVIQSDAGTGISTQDAISTRNASQSDTASSSSTQDATKI